MDDIYKTCVCAVCGKKFDITPEWALTNYKGAFVCSPKCNYVAFKKIDPKAKIERDDRLLERVALCKKRAKARARGEEPPVFEKKDVRRPVDVINKKDGSLFGSYPSITAAAKATQLPQKRVSQIAANVIRNTTPFDFIVHGEPRKGDPRKKRFVNTIWRETLSHGLILLRKRQELIN